MSEKIIKVRKITTVSTDNVKEGISRTREVSRVFAHIFGGVTKVMDMAHEVIEDIESGHDIEYRHAQKKRRLQRQKRSVTGESRTDTREAAVKPKKVVTIEEDDDTDDYEPDFDMNSLLEGTGLEAEVPKVKNRKSTQKPTANIKSPKGIIKPKKRSL